MEPNIEENYYLQNNVIPGLILHSLDQGQPPLLLFSFFSWRFSLKAPPPRKSCQFQLQSDQGCFFDPLHTHSSGGERAGAGGEGRRTAPALQTQLFLISVCCGKGEESLLQRVGKAQHLFFLITRIHNNNKSKPNFLKREKTSQKVAG